MPPPPPNPVFSINASVTSSTEATKSKTVILMEKEKMYLCLNQFAKKVFIRMISVQIQPFIFCFQVVLCLGRNVFQNVS